MFIQPKPRRRFISCRSITHTTTLIVAWCLLSSLLHAADATGSRPVYRCKSQGLTTFSDTPCASDAEIYETDVSRVSAYEPVQTPTPRRVAAAKQKPRAQPKDSIAADQARQAAACERINDSLRDIKSKMRAGYDVRTGERMREKQAKLDKKRKAASCR